LRRCAREKILRRWRFFGGKKRGGGSFVKDFYPHGVEKKGGKRSLTIPECFSRRWKKKKGNPRAIGPLTRRKRGKRGLFRKKKREKGGAFPPHHLGSREKRRKEKGRGVLLIAGVAFEGKKKKKRKGRRLFLPATFELHHEEKKKKKGRKKSFPSYPGPANRRLKKKKGKEGKEGIIHPVKKS